MSALFGCRYYLVQPAKVHEHYHGALMECALGRESTLGPEGHLRRRSVQVQPIPVDI